MEPDTQPRSPFSPGVLIAGLVDIRGREDSR
jgi:hypothetical protein